MKKVLPNNLVAHYWANQIQPEGRNSQNNLYFVDNTIYSYGSHFAIAKHVVNDRGEKGTLFTTRKYSNTTAKQVNEVHNASNHLNIIYCYDPTNDNNSNIKEFIKGIKNELIGLQRAKKPEKYIDKAQAVYNQLEKYCNFFDLEIPIEANEVLEFVKNGKYIEYLKLEAEIIEKTKQEAEEKRILKIKLNLKLWRKFKLKNLWNRLNDRDFLRFNTETNRIETSQGIEIPVKTAKTVFKWIMKTIEDGGCTDCNYKILEFEVKEVNKSFIWIGCHKIDIKEIKKIAKQLNF